MSEKTEPIEPDSAPPAATTAAPTEPMTPATSTPVTPAVAPATRRSVTLPLLPLGIVGGVIVALLFFGGGVAIGYGVASHDGRSDNAQQFRGGTNGYEFGNGNGFAPRQNQGGQNQGGQNQQGPNGRPGDRSTPAPNNG
jgi:hypothetical protein